MQSLIEIDDFKKRNPGVSYPDEETRRNPPGGHQFKLAFSYNPDKPLRAEFLWVSVHAREANDDIFYGRVDDIPVLCEGLRIGDEVQFSSKHIFGIIGMK